MEGIKVLHTGDIHLGYGFDGDYEYIRTRRKELRETFSYIIELCRQESVDVMLIAGDLFHNDCPDEELVSFVIQELKKIEDVIVMIAPGNHDYYIEGSYYDRINTLCNNVFVFDGDMDYYEFNIKNQVVRIYGAGFRSGIVRESLMKQRIIPKDISISLGVFHGTISGQENKNNYNPISVKQIESNNFDYLALGHIHKQTNVLNAGMSNYAYCGCPEGLSFGTQGTKGVYIGMVYNGYADMKYVPTSKRIYDEIKININSLINEDNNSYKDFYIDYKYIVKYIENVMKEKYEEDYIENIYRIVIEWSISSDIKESISVEKIKRELDYIFRLEIYDNSEIRDSEYRVNVSKAEFGKNIFYISEIHIGAFGGLKDFRQKYTSGFNLIYGKNEYGKSTIVAFIRMMLYGSASKSKDISQNIRKKYEPFSGEKMCGSIECVLNGVTYLVEKEIGRTKGNDVRHIYEKDSGREIVLPKEQEAGEYFLGINEEDFLKTVLVDNAISYDGEDIRNGLLRRITNINAGLSLSNTSISSNDSNIEELDKEIERLISKRGKSGEIPELTEQIGEYREELSRLQSERSNLQEKNRENNYMEERERKILSQLVEEIEELEESGQGDKSEYHIYRFKYILHFCIVIVMGIADMYMLFVSGRYKWGKIALAVSGVLTIVYGIKLILDKLGMEKNKPYDHKLAGRIDVIKSELGYEGYSVRQLNNRIDEIDRHLSEGTDKVDERINVRIEKCEKRIRELVDKRNRLKEIYDKKVSKRNELVKEAERVGEMLSKPLNKRTTELLNAMTGDCYEGIIIDENYNVKIKKRGMATYKEWKHLSTATAMQTYLALRISLCEMLEENGVTVPLLMDDIVYCCDDERTKRTLHILKSLDRQVILFTCKY